MGKKEFIVIDFSPRGPLASRWSMGRGALISCCFVLFSYFPDTETELVRVHLLMKFLQAGGPIRQPVSCSCQIISTNHMIYVALFASHGFG